MTTNQDILEDEYCLSSSNSSIRSEFDDAYYNMKPPPPKLADYEGKIVVIQNGQFQQTQAASQNLNLSNTTKLQSKGNKKQNRNNKKKLHSESKTFTNSKKVLNNAPMRKKFEKGHSGDFHTNRSNVEQLPNYNNVITSTFYNRTNINTLQPTQQYQNVTTNENFVGRLNYAGALSNNSNAKENNTKSQQCPISQSNTSNMHQHPTSWSRVVERTHGINQNATDSQNTKEAGVSERTKQLPYQNTTSISTRPEGNQLYNVPIPIVSTSQDTILIIDRENTPTASKKLGMHSSEYSQTYNTFLAEQPTTSTVNTIQIQQPTNSIQTCFPVAETESENCCRICCFWFTCCD